MRVYRVRLPALVLAGLSLLSPGLSQTVDLNSISGRWTLTLETDLRRDQMPVDLQVDKQGVARLVLLGPTDGDDGLYEGKLIGDQLSLTGRFSGFPAELSLKLNASRLTGRMTSQAMTAQVEARRVNAGASEVPVKQYKMLGEAVWNGVDLYFYDTRFNGVDWVAVKDSHLPGIGNARNEGELAIAIRRMLRELRVSNLNFFLSTGLPTRLLKVDRLIWKSLSPDAGYLAIRDFSPDNLWDFDKQLDRAMDELGKYPGLVVDLRGNRGENLEAALAALNFLLPEGRSVAYFATRDGLARLGVNSIDQINPASLPASFVDNTLAVSKFQGAGMYLAGGKYKRPYLGRIAVLIDEGCRGSCEVFAAAMKEAGVATLIGRRTPGAVLFSSPVSFIFVKWIRVVRSQVKGWRMDLPQMEVRTARGLKLEGHGVEPEIAVERSAGVDAELTRALQWLKEK